MGFSVQIDYINIVHITTWDVDKSLRIVVSSICCICQLLHACEHLEVQSARQSLQACIESIISWMSQNILKLNLNKTEAFFSSSSHKPCLLKNINLGPIHVEISRLVRILGSWFLVWMSSDSCCKHQENMECKSFGFTYSQCHSLVSW